MNKFKLNELGSVNRGRSRHRPRNDPALYNGKYPFIQTGDVKHSPFYITSHSQTYNERGLQQSKLWPEGTLCITIAANIADTAILTYPACFPDSIIGFLANKEKSDTKYVKYCLDTFKLQMQAISQGTTQDNMSLQKLLAIEFPVPDINKQRKIAAILSAYDDLIENNKRRIALLEKMAEEIYREWFVRFRFPSYRTTEFKKGKPKNWQEIKFEEFCMLKRGYDLPNSLIENGSFPVIASTSIKAYHNQFKVSPPVITTGRSGSLGTVIYSNKKSWPLNTTLYVKDFKDNSPYLIYYYLKEMKLEQFNAGAGVPSLNRNHLATLKLARPNKEIQNKFDENIHPIFKNIEQLEYSNENLEKTKNLLLPRLISGKLSIEDLDIQFPPSMQDEPSTR